MLKHELRLIIKRQMNITITTFNNFYLFKKKK